MLGQQGLFARISGLGLGAALVLCGQVLGETSPPMFMQIVPLPGYQFCAPRAISGDGLTIVGRVFTPSPPPAIAEAFLWNEKSGMIGLGVLPDTQGSGAEAVSDDGSVVVGSSGNPDVNIAFRWTMEDGIQPLPSLLGATITRAKGVSGDGLVVCGDSGTDANCTMGFRWTEATGIVAIGSLPPNPPLWSQANGISANGLVIAGSSDECGGAPRAIKWSNGVMQSIYSPPGLIQSARAVSANGSVIVGGSFGNAFRWTAPTGGQQIPNMTFGWAVSADGSVVGATAVQGRDEVARIWTSECSTRTLRDLLLAAGLSEVAGWQLGSIYGIADDNRTIVGVGIAPGSSAGGFGLWDGFIARLPRKGDNDFDGDVDVDDLLKVINSWGTCAPGACTFLDVNCDGAVGLTDLNAIIDNWDL